MSSVLGRIPRMAIFGTLIAVNLVFLLLAVREFRQAQTVHQLFRQGTPEAYAEAVGKADANHDRLLLNLGNLYFEQALTERGPAAARAALGYYREALRLNPGLMEAKKNFEVTERFLDSLVPPRDPREPRPPERMQSSQMPLKPHDI